jgi:hypothetical protein
MCIGIAFDVAVLDQAFIQRFGLAKRIAGDLFGPATELCFQFNDRVPQLPIIRAGQTDWELVVWGNRDQEQSRLPKTGWAREESLLAGKWQYLRPEVVKIPAQRGHEKQVWFPIPATGITGLLVADEEQQPHVFMLTRTASPEYEQLTRHDRMPVWWEETSASTAL